MRTWPQKVSDIADSKILTLDQKLKKLYDLSVEMYDHAVHIKMIDESTGKPFKKRPKV